MDINQTKLVDIIISQNWDDIGRHGGEVCFNYVLKL